MDISHIYNPKEIARKWLALFAKEKIFSFDKKGGSPFSTLMPPPNVTGVLHMGHALGNVLQDIVMRAKRMKGFDVFWQIGLDHAGIATQSVVERELLRREKKKRSDYPKEEFLKKVTSFVKEKEEAIKKQLSSLGLSVDMTTMRYTLDDSSCDNVIRTFYKMFKDGLLYRGDYLVNWDPVTQTALANDEVENETIDSFLWYFKYPVEDSFIEIATTRPETLLGDVAIAVHTDEDKWEGKHAIVPIVDREVPIIRDYMVKKEFGTGAVKITPAHDFRDYDIAKRHGLPSINIMTKDGRISFEGEFKGMSMIEAREAVAKKMDSLGFLIKKEPYEQTVGISYRSKARIEPFLSKQWFVNMERLREITKPVLDIEIIPPEVKDQYENWIEKAQDWCISRQLWWGHNIPVWYNKKNPNKIICQKRLGEIPEEILKNKDAWVKEEDVLDTWFSSAIWPVTTAFLNQRSFYPFSVLITGFDLVFFWVTKMAIMSYYLTENVPFLKVFFHGLVYSKSYRHSNGLYATKDEKHRYDRGEKIPPDMIVKSEKMSKSKNNGIDPLQLIDEFGLDAVRFNLAYYTTALRPLDLDLRLLKEHKHFMSKIWNAARFTLSHLDSSICPHPIESKEDKWIICELNKLIENVSECLKDYKFKAMASSFYSFFWDKFCCEYIEVSKPALFGKQQGKEVKKWVLFTVLDNFVRLLNPISPIITEEIYSLLGKVTKTHTNAFCALSDYPTPVKLKTTDKEQIKTSIVIQELLPMLRKRKTEFGIDSSAQLYISPLDEGYLNIMKNRYGLKEIYNYIPDGAFSYDLVISQSNFTKDNLSFKVHVKSSGNKRKLVSELEKLDLTLETMVENMKNLRSSNSLKKEVEGKLSKKIEEFSKKKGRLQRAIANYDEPK